jgi:non-heme chloroperoxidase
MRRSSFEIPSASRREVLGGMSAAGLAAVLSTAPATRVDASAGDASAKDGDRTMASIKTSDGTEIFYKDWGPKTAPPIVFHHGWPLSADDWDNQMMFFLSHGYRVIAHDRRGHGRSAQTDIGNEMDTYASMWPCWLTRSTCKRPCISVIRRVAGRLRATSHLPSPAGLRRRC